MKIVHLSDLHFGPYFQEDVAENLRRCIKELQVDVVVVSGDLTQRARAGEFQTAVEYLRTLTDQPIVVVPGNHDVPLYNLWERFLNPLRNYTRFLGDYPSSLETEDGLIVGLNSTDPYRSVVNGRVGVKDLDTAAEKFSNVPTSANKYWRIIVLHHHLLPPPGWDRRRPMPKAKRLLERLNDMQIDLVLSGHLHRAYVGNTLDVFPGRVRSNGIVVVQCGTSTSRRGRGFEREKNSFNVITLTDTLTVEHWMYFATENEEPNFQCTSKHNFGS